MDHLLQVCLNRHLKQAHVDRPNYKSVSYKCKMCLLTFPSIALMRDHFRDSHPTALVFHCRHCSTTLKTKKTLKTHIKVMAAFLSFFYPPFY